MREVVRALVRPILDRPFDEEWTLQGLGMLRLRLSDSVRLHVWTGEHRVKDVSEVHSHPWHFRSYVVSGQVENQIYRVTELDPSSPRKPTHLRSTILCGEGGGLEGEPEPVVLEPEWRRNYSPGQSYTQASSQVHSSHPRDGAVTLIEKVMSSTADPDRAYVFWEAGREWVSAEPRPATRDEIQAVTARALELWDS